MKACQKPLASSLITDRLAVLPVTGTLAARGGDCSSWQTQRCGTERSSAPATRLCA